jgi:acetyl esterase
MTLDPQVQALLAATAKAGLPRLYTLSPEAARTQMSATLELIPRGPEMAAVYELSVPVRDAEIGARHYEPHEMTGGTIVWFHGGGWVLSNLDSHDPMCRALAHASRCRVVSIDYRLAPEHPFPTPLEDCWDSLTWIHDRYAKEPIVVGGDSAGANMAAVCAIRARDLGGPPIALQVLVYPVTDHDFETESYRVHGGEDTLMGRREMIWFFDHYAPAGTDRDDPEISPLRRRDLTRLPEAIVVTAGHDPLSDEGRAYATRLGEAGIEVAHHHHGDMIHGFFSFPGVLDAGSKAIVLVGKEINNGLGSGPARRGATEAGPPGPASIEQTGRTGAAKAPTLRLRRSSGRVPR